MPGTFCNILDGLERSMLQPVIHYGLGSRRPNTWQCFEFSHSGDVYIHPPGINMAGIDYSRHVNLLAIYERLLPG